jgi:CHASE3 domain sensor protein
MVELLVAGLIVVLVALLTCLASAVRSRRRPSDSITEAQARENAAPLTTAILASARRERMGV